MSNLDLEWLGLLRAVATRCADEIPAQLRTPLGRGIVNTKPDGDPTIAAELYIEEIVSHAVTSYPIRAKLYSEERGLLVDKVNAEFVVLLDPIDGTFLATRGLPGSCIGISVHQADTMRPIASVVGDYYTRDLYWASEQGAFMNGAPMTPSQVTTLQTAFVSTCYGKASRIGLMLEHKGLIGTVFWTETTGSMLSMVRVGSGRIDAYWDLMLGYKSYDFAAGAYIAQAAGCIVTDENGSPLKYPQDLEQRCKFIIAANQKLHSAILEAAAL